MLFYYIQRVIRARTAKTTIKEGSILDTRNSLIFKMLKPMARMVIPPMEVRSARITSFIKGARAPEAKTNTAW